MGMYDQFGTDKDMEKNGITIDYGDFRVRIARAGGSNQKYARVVEQLTKPYRRAIQTETLSNDISMELLHRAYARAVILNWETKVDEEFQPGIENPDGGELLTVTEENLVRIFQDLPDLFADIRSQAEKAGLFRKEIQEQDAGN